MVFFNGGFIQEERGIDILEIVPVEKRTQEIGE
jgi:hypothetical protein